MVYDVRARSERDFRVEELQRTSHKDPKGSSKCACVVHSGGPKSSGRAYDEMDGGEEREKGRGTESLLVNR